MDRLEVARFSTLPEAELAVGLLRRHDIDAQVVDREMSNSAPHLQIALGGVRISAPAAQIAQARDIVGRARRGEFGDLGESEDWRADATPGRIGELHDHEVQGVMGGMKRVARGVVLAILLMPVATCAALFALSD